MFGLKSSKNSESSADDHAHAGGDSASNSKNKRKNKTAAEAQNAAVTPEKRRARRRLVGVITLMLALILFLPMLFDAQPHNAPQAEIDIVVAKKPLYKAPEKPLPPHVVEQPPKAKASKASTVKPKKAVKAVKPVKKVAPSLSKSKSVVIQVAALGTKDKVAVLQNRLKKAGIASFTQKIKTSKGYSIRVRVGPFVNKDKTKSTCAKLAKMKLNCQILAN